MYYSYRRKIGFLAVAMLMVLAVSIQPGWAETTTDPLRIHQTESEAIAIYKKTQKAEDHWAEEKTNLQARYRSLQAEEKTVARQHAVLQAQVSALKARVAEAERTVAETARVEETLQPHLNVLVDRLESQIERDLPFLPEERAMRMADIKKVLAQPDTSLAERSRRVMEAIKIETEYGQTVEVYQQTIHVDGQTIMADILRVGRLALYWRSPDGKTVGQWDRVAKAWTTLDKDYRRAINDATEMAFKRRTVDMVKLPLGRIAQR